MNIIYLNTLEDTFNFLERNDTPYIKLYQKYFYNNPLRQNHGQYLCEIYDYEDSEQKLTSSIIENAVNEVKYAAAMAFQKNEFHHSCDCQEFFPNYINPGVHDIRGCYVNNPSNDFQNCVSQCEDFIRYLDNLSNSLFVDFKIAYELHWPSRNNIEDITNFNDSNLEAKNAFLELLNKGECEIFYI